MPRTTSPAAATRTDPEALLRAFAEPTRLRLLSLLSDGETCVCDLVAALDLPQPTVSRHLAVLRGASMVVVRKKGLWCWYSLAPAQGALHAKLLECLRCCQSELPGLVAIQRRCAGLRAGRCC